MIGVIAPIGTILIVAVLAGVWYELAQRSARRRAWEQANEERCQRDRAWSLEAQARAQRE